MCVSDYGSIKPDIDVKLPKYNLSYNSRNPVNSLAKSTSDRKYEKIFCRMGIVYDNIMMAFIGKVSYLPDFLLLTGRKKNPPAALPLQIRMPWANLFCKLLASAALLLVDDM